MSTSVTGMTGSLRSNMRRPLDVIATNRHQRFDRRPEYLQCSCFRCSLSAVPHE